MTHFRVSEAAHLLGVSDDTVRRWVDQAKLAAHTDDHGRLVVTGISIAKFMQESAPDLPHLQVSARNRFDGLVTRVEKDGVMALVEIQAGPHRVISLMSREAADELGLEPGTRAAATVKATQVIVDTA
jgi:molybdopterin-binding protein